MVLTIRSSKVNYKLSQVLTINQGAQVLKKTTSWVELFNILSNFSPDEALTPLAKHGSRSKKPLIG